MDGGGTYIWMGGTEYELRPASAGELLRARRESREICEELEITDEGERALVLASCVAARMIYSDGEPAFESGQEVLESFTTEEIFNAAREYGEIKPVDIKLKDEGEAPSGSLEDGIKGDAGIKNAAGNKRRSVWEYVGGEMIRPESRRYGEDGSLAGSDPSGERNRTIYTHAAEYAEDTSVDFLQNIQEDSGGPAKMRSISEFFERDSRRYDAAYRQY